MKALRLKIEQRFDSQLSPDQFEFRIVVAADSRGHADCVSVSLVDI